MKKIFLTLTLFAFLVAPATALGADNRQVSHVATVKSVAPSGTLEAKYKKGSKWTTIKNGTRIVGKKGALIKTGANVSLELSLGSLINVQIGPDTQVEMRDLYISRWDDQAVLVLQKGAVTGSAKKGLGHRANFVVTVDKLTANIKNGELKVTANKDQKVFGALKGKAQVVEVDTGANHAIARGKELIADSNGLRINESARPGSWRPLLWLLSLPAVIIILRFFPRKKRPPGRRVKRTYPGSV